MWGSRGWNLMSLIEEMKDRSEVGSSSTDTFINHPSTVIKKFVTA